MVLPSQNSSETFDLFTQQFIGPVSTLPTFVATYYGRNGTIVRHKPSFYWDKVHNLGGKALTVSMLNYVPYSITRKMVNSKLCLNF